MAERPAGGRGERVVRLLLRLHPAAFRERFGDALRETYAMRAAEAGRRGRWRLAVFQVREWGGLLVSALREQRSSRRAASGGAAGTVAADGTVVEMRSRVREGGAAGRVVSGLVRELAGALRRLARAPWFTAASVLMLGLGIGASAAVYTLVHRVVLRPLPYAEPERLVWLDHGAPGYGFERGIGIAVWQYVQYGESSRQLEGLALAQRGAVTLIEGTTAPERVLRAIVSPSLMRVLGVAPALGRWFDDVTARDVIVSHALWQRRWGGDASVLGRVVRLSGTEHRVIGVMPAGFAIPDAATELWTVQEYTASWPDGGFNYVAVGRMVEGATPATLRSELQSLMGRAQSGDDLQVARRIAEGRVRALPLLLSDHVVGPLRGTLWMLLGAVLLVLLTAWANVANLFLVRADARRREVAVRRAIGAGRGAIVRFFLAEGAWLAALSWLLGAAVAWVAVRAITGFAALDLPRSDEIVVDGHVLLGAAALALLAALGLTGIPLSQRTPPATVLCDSARGTTAGRARLRFRAGLMAAQVALALMLLAGSGLLVRSWLNVRATSPGFLADDALFFEIGLAAQDVASRARAALFHEEVAAGIAGLPGVTRVAFATCLPLDGYCWYEGIVPEGGTDADRVVVSMRRVSAAFFDALELPILEGRAFDANTGAMEDAVVLSRQSAARLFPAGNAVGRRVAIGSAAPDAQWFRVIGVAADAATTSVMESRPELVFYLPIRDSRDQAVTIHRMSFIVRTDGDPAALAASVRAIVHERSPETAVARVRTLSDVLAGGRAHIALATVLLLLAAAIALLLGALGIYAVFAFVIGRRTAEFGLRLALGARARDVVRIVAAQAGLVTLAGIALGLAGAAALTRSLAALLFGVQPLDGAVFTLATLILLASAFLAALLPARRAWRLRPLDALRTD